MSDPPFLSHTSKLHVNRAAKPLRGSGAIAAPRHDLTVRDDGSHSLASGGLSRCNGAWRAQRMGWHGEQEARSRTVRGRKGSVLEAW